MEERWLIYYSFTIIISFFSDCSWAFFFLAVIWFSLPDKIQVNGLYSGRGKNDYDFVGGKKAVK